MSGNFFQPRKAKDGILKDTFRLARNLRRRLLLPASSPISPNSQSFSAPGWVRPRWGPRNVPLNRAEPAGDGTEPSAMELAAGLL